ncbi:MAG TPA: RNA polymerase factor sigma-54 [Acidobacteriaceae bacterium]|nr:RNA polymerase factor sigma-54 [Acidobacteriaceae bacterium]
MALLQPKLSLKVAQRQILTPGLMQMVSVLALNKLELKELINTEIVENPVLEELEESVPLLDEVAHKEADRERTVEEVAADRDKKDPFDEIDFGSYFQDYLDPGFRTPSGFEQTDKPSFENFLSQPSTLTDHLFWQLGSLNLSSDLRAAAEYVVGNLDEDGYLVADDEELLAGLVREFETESGFEPGAGAALLAEAVQLVQNLDPVGVATRSLRECLLVQIEAQRREFQLQLGRRRAAQSDSAVMESEQHETRSQVFSLAARIVDQHLSLLQKRDLREMSKVLGAPGDAIQQAIDFIRSLDPRPGQRFNRTDARLIEPDVAFVKRGGEFVVVMNEEDLPTLRLNHGYRKLLSQEGTERDVKEYVKERYRSALQLMRNIEQRKNTILRTCEVIVRRQSEFLERGVDALKPMMIKEIAEEIGVHPSTVSRAVSSKYVHTPQGVFELRFFFSEGVHGPEGGSTPLMLLKRKVKKLIDEEDPRKPLTDDLIASMLEAQGIDVTRRTVAKYREDLRIPSTHQRRVRD